MVKLLIVLTLFVMTVTNLSLNHELVGDRFIKLTKKGSDDYADCAGTYVIDPVVLVNGYPIYIGLNGQRFIFKNPDGHFGITANQYLGMFLKEENEKSWGAFHASTNSVFNLKDSTWKSYNTEVVEFP